MTWLRPIRPIRAIRALRVLILALALPLMSAGALPVWAHLFGVEGPHVCHCSIEKHDCDCARCHTDHPDDLKLLTSSESLKGRCGDNEVAFGGKAIQALLPADFVLPPIAERAVYINADEALPPLIPSRPPIPPPRSVRS